ncbi:MAG TPA: tetratricopeptide repeat protein [Gemmatimonadaceae bacterium]
MPRTGAAARPDLEERAQNLLEWAELHSKQLTIVAVAIIAIAGGVWFYQKSHQARTRNASAALAQAEQAVGAGNLALAQSDLDKIVSRYGGTVPGKQAILVLAQVLYDRGQYAQGIQQLQKLVDSDDAYLRAGALNLIGAGYEQQAKYADAAASYRKAADATAYPADRDQYLASAARALTSAGKTAEAKEIWSKLAADPTSPTAAEARVRLGEIEAKAARSGAGD